MPLLLMDDSSDDDSLLLMVMMNSMSGGLKSQAGFDSNFNLLLPLLIKDCAASDTDCKKKQKNMLVMMMVMQSQVRIPKSRCHFLPILVYFHILNIYIVRLPLLKWAQIQSSLYF